MMGSGKSSIGLLVSKKLNKDFIGVDDEIEKKLDMKISKIFENKGEKYFRGIEEEITLKLLKNKKSVISLGGGSILSKKVQKLLVNKSVHPFINTNLVFIGTQSLQM